MGGFHPESPCHTSAIASCDAINNWSIVVYLGHVIVAIAYPNDATKYETSFRQLKMRLGSENRKINEGNVLKIGMFFEE